MPVYNRGNRFYFNLIPRHSGYNKLDVFDPALTEDQVIDKLVELVDAGIEVKMETYMQGSYVSRDGFRQRPLEPDDIILLVELRNYVLSLSNKEKYILRVLFPFETHEFDRELIDSIFTWVDAHNNNIVAEGNDSFLVVADHEQLNRLADVALDDVLWFRDNYRRERSKLYEKLIDTDNRLFDYDRIQRDFLNHDFLNGELEFFIDEIMPSNIDTEILPESVRLQALNFYNYETLEDDISNFEEWHNEHYDEFDEEQTEAIEEMITMLKQKYDDLLTYEFGEYAIFNYMEDIGIAYDDIYPELVDKEAFISYINKERLIEHFLEDIIATIGGEPEALEIFGLVMNLK